MPFPRRADGVPARGTLPPNSEARRRAGRGIAGTPEVSAAASVPLAAARVRGSALSGVAHGRIAVASRRDRRSDGLPEEAPKWRPAFVCERPGRPAVQAAGFPRNASDGVLRSQGSSHLSPPEGPQTPRPASPPRVARLLGRASSAANAVGGAAEPLAARAPRGALAHNSTAPNSMCLSRLVPGLNEPHPRR